MCTAKIPLSSQVESWKYNQALYKNEDRTDVE